MPPIRLILILILILREVTCTSMPEDITNFQINQSRNPSRNINRQDQQIQNSDTITENESYETQFDGFKDPIPSPSEVLETHILPEEAVVDGTADISSSEDPNMQKRPRRRRRRRRRKRPKITPSPDEHEVYASSPSDEEINRDPIKYRPQENVEGNLETVTPSRRRPMKRRRRPFKRPPTDFPLLLEESSSNNPEEVSSEVPNLENSSPSEDRAQEELVETSPEPSENTEMHELAPRNPSIQPAPPLESNHRKSKPTQELNILSTIESSKVQKETKFSKNIQQNENRKDVIQLKDSDTTKFSKTSAETTSEEPTTIAIKKRKRPPLKIENSILNEVAKHEVDLSKAESVKQETDAVSHEQTSIVKNETNIRKESKIRRLPPPSAIFRQFKRPKPKDVTTKAQQIEDITSTKEPTTTKAEELLEKNHKQSESVDIFVTSSTQTPERNYEFSTSKQPETKHPVQPKTPFTIPSTTSTTENTAFIYISCNHTINEILKSKLNLTGNNLTLSASEYFNLIHAQNNTSNVTPKPTPESQNVTNDNNFESLKSIALGELEKLLQEIKNTADITTSNPLTTVKKVTHPYPNHQYHNPTQSESQEISRYTTKFDPSAFVDFKTTTDFYYREPKWIQDPLKSQSDFKKTKIDVPQKSTQSSLAKDFILSYTSTVNPNFIYNDIDPDESLLRETELSMYLRNNSLHRKILHENLVHRNSKTNERKKLPLAVKSAIIISGAILALAILGFFALLLSCKIRQAKSRMKCHRELYRGHFHNSEFRQSSRSTSPVVSKSNYSGRTFTNNMQPNVASNRNYYLWQTLRKTFQYD